MKSSVAGPALRISLIYAVVAGLWILLSDRLLAVLISKSDQLIVWQTYKGWAFVAVTTVLLFSLLWHELKKRRSVEEALRGSAAQTYELSTLLDVSRKVAVTLELGPLLALILDSVESVIDYTSISILSLEDEVKPLAYRGPAPEKEALQFHFLAKAAWTDQELFDFREPIIIPDVRANTPLTCAFRERAGQRLETTFGYVRSWMGVPLMVKEEVIGLLSLSYDEPNYYSPHQAELAFAFANHAAVAIENARLYSATKQHVDELEALYRADEEVYRHLHLNQVLQSLVDVAVGIFHAEKSSLMVWDTHQERLIMQAARGFCPETLWQLTNTLSDGLVAQMAARGEALIVEDAAKDTPLDRNITEPEGIRSFILVPIEIDEQIFGIFNANYSQPRAFDNRAERLFTALAQRAALAIKNARLYEQAQHAAVIEERQRLARELHDAVTQTLFSASLIAEVMPRLWTRNREEANRRLEELRQLTRGALAEMRTLLLELRPAALTEAKLDELLRHLTEAITGRSRMPVTLEVEGDCSLPPEVQVALYRITQEALNNVAKHARANQAVVNLRCQPNQVELRIEDDGRGFEPTHVSPEHLGLRIMRERAETIGAKLELYSQPEQGTRVNAVWQNRSAKEDL